MGIKVFRFFIKEAVVNSKVLLFIVIALLTLFYSLHKGHILQNSLEQDKTTFHALQQKRLKNYLLIEQYGIDGAFIKLIPPKEILYFSDSALFSGVECNVNSADRISIQISCQGNDTLKRKSKGIDFSTALFLIIVAGSFGYGYFFVSQSPFPFLFKSTPKKLYFTHLLARLTYLTALTFLIIIIPLIWSKAEFPKIHIIFLFSTEILFYFLGSLANKNKIARALVVVVLLLGFALTWIISDSSFHNYKSGHKMSLSNLERIMAAEKIIASKHGQWNGKATEEKLKDIWAILDEVFPKIYKEILRMNAQLETDVRQYHFLASLFPTSAYMVMKEEASGSGFISFLNFERKCVKLKEEFVHNFADEKYLVHKKRKRGEIPPLISNNFYFSQVHLPFYSHLSFALCFLYIVIFFSVDFFIFNWKFRRQLVEKTIKSNCGYFAVSCQPNKTAFLNSLFNSKDSFNRKIFYIPAPNEMKNTLINDYLKIFDSYICDKSLDGLYFENTSIVKRTFLLLSIALREDAEIIIFHPFSLENDSNCNTDEPELKNKIGELIKRNKSKRIFIQIHKSPLVFPKPDQRIEVIDQRSVN